MKALIFDTETTDMVKWKLPPEDESQPHLVQLAMLLVETGEWVVKARHAMLVRLAEGVAIEAGAQSRSSPARSSISSACSPTPSWPTT